MGQNVYSSAVFTGGRPLCTQILSGQGRPPTTILGIRELQTMGYGLPDGEPRIPLRSFVLTQYRSVTDVVQTDGLICRSICCTRKASFAARCENGKVETASC